jgi:hypothetical protein
VLGLFIQVKLKQISYIGTLFNLNYKSIHDMPKIFGKLKKTVYAFHFDTIKFDVHTHNKKTMIGRVNSEACLNQNLN